MFLIWYGHLLKIMIRFNSDIDLSVNTIIEFRSLLINVSCIIEKNNEYYPEIYLDECSYVKTSIYDI